MNAFLSQNRKYVKLKNREHANRIVWLILQYLQLMTVILNNDINVLKKIERKKQWEITCIDIDNQEETLREYTRINYNRRTQSIKLGWFGFYYSLNDIIKKYFLTKKTQKTKTLYKMRSTV